MDYTRINVDLGISKFVLYNKQIRIHDLKNYQIQFHYHLITVGYLGPEGILSLAQYLHNAKVLLIIKN